MPPFVSQAQRRYLYAKEPKVAKEFEKKTPKGKKLPEKMKQENMHNPPEPTIVKAKAKKHPGKAQ